MIGWLDEHCLRHWIMCRIRTITDKIINSTMAGAGTRRTALQNVSRPGRVAPEPGFLDPEPAAAGGALIGYARVSTTGQVLDRQQYALAEAGCAWVFADKLSGRSAERPELAACLDYLRPGDTLVVASLDRLSRRWPT